MIKKLLQQPVFFVLVLVTVLLCPTAFGQTVRSDNFPRSILKPGKLPPRNDLWVFILAGQSNMAGRGFVESEDTIPNNRILAINKNNEIVIAKEPLHFYEPTLTGLDCGVSFARKLLNDLPASASILLVPTAVGGSSIEQWLGDSVWRQVKLLSNFTEKIKVANDVGILKGILWHQGESNANTKAGIERYPNQMADLAEVFRKISKSPDLPVLVGEIGSFSRQPQLYDQFNKNLLQFVTNDKNSALVKTGDLSHKGDSLHFDTGAQRTLGERFAMAFKSRFLALTSVLPARAETDTTKNIVYAEVGNRKLLLDLYMPSVNSNPYLIIWVHGGAWHSGSKADPPLALVASGYALASIDFRLSTEAPFPAQIHDIKAAVRFLRANAKNYGYHADKIVIWGSSSGGHLVSLVGTTNNDPYYEGSEGNYLKESSAVQGIIDFYGPTNFLTILSQSTPHGINVRAPASAIFLGKPVEQAEDLAKKASPVFQVDRTDPATGRRDGPESPSIVVNLNRSMTEKNYKNTLEIPGNRFEKELDGFFSRQELILPRQFKEFVTGLPKDRLDQVTKSSLEVAFNRENFVTQLKKDLVGSPLPGTDSFVSKIENTLALPDEQFQQLFLQVSTEMHFLYQEDPIDPRQPLSPQQIFHLLTDYGTKSFFYRVNEFNMLVEDTMGILRLFVDMLTNGGIVKNVLNALSEIVMSQPPPVLSLIMQKFGVGEPLALEEVLRRQALEYIRGGLMMGILDVTPQNKITIQRSDISSLQAAN